MTKNTQNKNNLLSSALRSNLKLRKKQILFREKQNIAGKRIEKIGISNLIKKTKNEEFR